MSKQKMLRITRQIFYVESVQKILVEFQFTNLYSAICGREPICKSLAHEVKKHFIWKSVRLSSLPNKWPQS